MLDNSDEANAITIPYPRRTIAVYLTRPAGSAVNYDDWLYELLVHEYTHLLQCDMVSGVPDALRSVFGRLVLLNAVQPQFQIEGLAVYSESRYTPFGRNRSPFYQGMLRSAAAEGRWSSIDRASAYNSQWPWEGPYVYGGAFSHYLAQTYGQRKLSEYQERHSSLVLPFLQNRPATKTFGKSLSQLWSDWQRQASAGYQAQIESLRVQGFTGCQPLTKDGGLKSGLAISPDGATLAFFAYDGHEFPAIKTIDLRSGTVTAVHQGYVEGSMCFSPDGKLLAFGKKEFSDDGRQYFSDLYLLDLEGHSARRLSYGLRVRDPAFSRDGDILYFVASKLGANALGRMVIATGRAELLTSFEDSTLYCHLAMSPDGNTLALSARTGDGFQDIYLYTIGTGEFRPLAVDLFQELWPAWSKDGRKVYCGSDRSGIWNIRSFQLDSASDTRLTNVIGGIFNPALSSDGALYGLNLSSQGYDVVKVDQPQIFRGSSKFEPDVITPFEMPSDTILQTSPYRWWRTMAPVFWLPSGWIDENGVSMGAMVFGADALLRHSYSLSLGPGSRYDRLYYILDYSNTSLPADLSLSLSDMVQAYDVTVSGMDTVYYERQQTQSVQVAKGRIATGYATSAGLGYQHRRFAGLNDVMPGYNPYWTGNLANLNFGLAYSNAKRYLRSISPEDGRSVEVNVRLYHSFLGSDISQEWYDLAWREYIPALLRHHVLLVALRAGLWGQPYHVEDDIPDFAPRGYGQATRGSVKLMGTAEYRFPLWWIERGIGTWPVFLHFLNGALFVEGAQGSSTLSGGNTRTQRTSWGAELGSDWILFYGVRSRLVAGLTRAPDASGLWKYYIYMVTPFGKYDIRKPAIDRFFNASRQ